jgi:uncharacterized membrane protein SpoIIM required for sporulation
MKLFSWISEKQSARRYFIIISFLAFLGAIVRLTYEFYLDSTINYCPTTNVSTIYGNYLSQDIPRISNSFFDILFGNLQTALIIFLFPLCLLLLTWLIASITPILHKISMFVAGIEEKFKLDVYFPLFKLSTGLVTIFWGFNTFPFFCLFKLLPFQLFLSMFLHAIIEIPAFLIAACLALISVDDMRMHFHETSDFTLREIINVTIEILKKMWLYLLCIAFLILIAAVVETWISPQFLVFSFENYFQHN